MKNIFLLFVCAFFCVRASSQQLYGGGANMFRYDVATNAFTPLAAFNTSTCWTPRGHLTDGGNGKLYGFTINSAGSFGSVFSFDPVANIINCVHDFADTVAPVFNSVPGMLLDNGKLYGTTRRGVFSLDPSTNALVELAKFPVSVTERMIGAPVKAANGKFYGMAEQGGANNYGLIYTFDPTTNTLSSIHDFGPWPEAVWPQSTLVPYNDSLLYGVTAFGGNSDNGRFFKFNFLTNTFTNLLELAPPAADNPNAGFTLLQDGKLVGVSKEGGVNNAGTLYSFNPDSNLYATLHSFDVAGGYYPLYPPVLADDGNLYGITYSGGNNSYGVLYRYDLAAGNYTVIKHFQANEGNTETALVRFEQPDAIKPVVNQQINVYPNPATGYALVTFEAQTANTIANVYNAVGQVVLQYMIGKGQDRLQLNTSLLPKGMYNVTVGNAAVKLMVE